MSNKPHDMGGLPGGAIVPDFGKEAVFKEGWHGRALALTLAAGALGRKVAGWADQFTGRPPTC